MAQFTEVTPNVMLIFGQSIVQLHPVNRQRRYDEAPIHLCPSRASPGWVMLGDYLFIFPFFFCRWVLGFENYKACPSPLLHCPQELQRRLALVIQTGLVCPPKYHWMHVTCVRVMMLADAVNECLRHLEWSWVLFYFFMLIKHLNKKEVRTVFACQQTSAE